MWYTDIAKKRPLGPQTQARLRKHHKIILHTMVGSLWGTDSYFRQGGYSGTESHFGVGYDGEILQWQDDDYTADANLQGNDDCISIETADRGTGFPNWNTSGDNVPPWTAAQREAIAKIIARVAKRHGIPIVLISNTYDSTKGIGYHRQGVDPYRKHGEKYSNSFGKVCPGNKRIAQIPGIITRAKQIAGGNVTPPEEDEFMAMFSSKQDFQNNVRAALAPDVLRLKELHAMTRNLAVKNPVTGEDWPLDDALWSMWTYSYWARVDAGANRAILEAQVAQGNVTEAQIEELSKKARVAAFKSLPDGVGEAVDPELAAELNS